jgi:hypothetical protein
VAALLQDRAAHALHMLEEIEALMDPYMGDGPASQASIRDEECRDIIERIHHVLTVAKKEEVLYNM